MLALELTSFIVTALVLGIIAWIEYTLATTLPPKPKPFLRDIGGFVLEKSELIRLRLKAVRCGVWFRALSRLDRAVDDLTLRVVDGVRSFRLAAAILSIVKKLQKAVEGRVSGCLTKVGFQLALKLSLFAQKWGNVQARDWASDASFAKFLVIMHINDPKMFTP